MKKRYQIDREQAVGKFQEQAKHSEESLQLTLPLKEVAAALQEGVGRLMRDAGLELMQLVDLPLRRSHRCPHSDSNGCLDPVRTGSGVALDLVFPDANDEPSLTAEPAKISAVTPAVPFDLVFPISRQLAAPQREAPAMPVVAVDEDSHLRADENDIGLPR